MNSFRDAQNAQAGNNWRRLSWKTLAVAVVAAAALWFAGRWVLGHEEDTPEITATVVRADLPITVTEHGELESSRNVDVRCELEGMQNKLISILPEGIHVHKGEIVVRFDADQLKRQVLEQESKYQTAHGKAKAAEGELEVQKNKAASDVAKAELAAILAKLDRKKYEKGEYQVDVDEKTGDIQLARKNLADAQEKLEHYRTFVKKGFGTEEQLRVKELEVEQLQYLLRSKEAKLRVLEQFQRERQEAELKFKDEDAVRELSRAKKSGAAAIEKADSDLKAAQAAAAVEKTALDRLQKQLQLCEIKAPQDGILVYSKDRYWDPTSKIQPGAMVHFQQNVFSLPDLTQMQVKVKIHESMIKKVKIGQKAEIIADAYPSIVMHGTVQSVATLADSAGPWDERAVKEYVTVVKVTDLATSAGLKPGMSALVKIFANNIPQVLIVPVQSVTERDDKHICYVATGHGIDRREVQVGENNEEFVEIRSGLSEGDRVCLDARARANAEAKASGEKPQESKPAAAPARPS